MPNNFYDKNAETYKSFSATDIIPYIIAQDQNGKHAPYAIGNISTISYSIHQEKGQVRTLGRGDCKGITRGTITYAWSFVYSVFDRRALYQISKIKGTANQEQGIRGNRPIIASLIPAFDVLLYFANEYGQEAYITMFGVEIIDEGQVHSVQDVYIENTMSFIFKGIDLLTPSKEAETESFLDMQYLTNTPIKFLNESFTRVNEFRNNIATGKIP